MTKRKSIKYTTEMIEFVRSHVSQYTDKEIAEMMCQKFDIHVTENRVTNLKTRNNIRNGVKRGTFNKGHVPLNKGLKQTEYMSKEAIERTKGTRFKQGHKPANHRPVGSERIDSKDGYILVKVAEPNVWKAKHRMLWEQHNGPIPHSHRIIFLNGVRTDVRLENLALTSFAESAVMSKQGLFDSDPGITKVGINIAKLSMKTSKKAMSERRKRKNGKGDR